jgi:hypothetical protein
VRVGDYFNFIDIASFESIFELNKEDVSVCFLFSRYLGYFVVQKQDRKGNPQSLRLPFSPHLKTEKWSLTASQANSISDLKCFEFRPFSIPSKPASLFMFYLDNSAGGNKKTVKVHETKIEQLADAEKEHQETYYQGQDL